RLVASDSATGPQGCSPPPDSVVAVGRAIVHSPAPYAAGKAAALTAVGLLRAAHHDGCLRLSQRETPMLDLVDDAVQALPDREAAFIDQMLQTVDTGKFVASEYGL